MTFRIATVALAAVTAGLCLAGPALCAVTISAKATKNVTCSAGVCTATAAKAFLNATKLANLLAASDVKIVSGTEALDIVSAATLSWVSPHRLTLDASRSIQFQAAMVVAGPGGLTLTTNDGSTLGTLSFAGAGRVEFWDGHSDLVIDGESYKLVRGIKPLARAIAQNPQGFFALARPYDAKRDGIYGASPISTEFSGTYEGLGNSISHLTIANGDDLGSVGLFSILGNQGFAHMSVVRDLRLVRETVTYTGVHGTVGGLAASTALGSVIGVDVDATISAPQATMAGILVADVYGGPIAESFGKILDSSSSGSVDGATEAIGGLVGHVDNSWIIRCHSSASVSSPDTEAGGLVGFAESDYAKTGIDHSYATGSVTMNGPAHIGGLVGNSVVPVTNSYATGAVRGGQQATVGGLIGQAVKGGTIANSYAEGAVTGGSDATVGGLVGYKLDAVSSSYSTGRVSGGSNAIVGGSIAYDATGDALNNADIYWDTDTSRIDKGIGNLSFDRGVTGLTTAQLQARLPKGFDRAIWGGNQAVNGGLPFLRGMAPQ